MKDEVLKLALEALESCDFTYTFGNGGYQQFDRALVDKAITAIKQALAAQPAVPDAIHHTDLSEHPQYIEGWNDCRAEMLKGMKP
jgi:hypothetical protein